MIQKGALIGRVGTTVWKKPNSRHDHVRKMGSVADVGRDLRVHDVFDVVVTIYNRVLSLNEALLTLSNRLVGLHKILLIK